MSRAGKATHHREDTSPAVTPWRLQGRKAVPAYRNRALVEAAHPLMLDLFRALGGEDAEAPCFAEPDDWTDPADAATAERAADRCWDCRAVRECLVYAEATKAEGVVQGGTYFPLRTNPATPATAPEEEIAS